MKKFIIVIVFVFLIAIFISFNYLLWDREQQLEDFQNMSNTKNLSIEALGDKINTLDKQNKQLTEQLQATRKENDILREDKLNLNIQNQGLQQKINDKNVVIIGIKNSLDSTAIDATLKKWSEAVDKGNYEAAFNCMDTNSQDVEISDFNKFKERYQKEVKGIKFKSSKIFIDTENEEKIDEIHFKVVFEITKPEAAKQEIYINGANEKYVTMKYIISANDWVISEIREKP